MSLSFFRSQRPLPFTLTAPGSKVARQLTTTSAVPTSLKLEGSNTRGKKALENALRIDEREKKGHIFADDTTVKMEGGNGSDRLCKKQNGKGRKDLADLEGRAVKDGNVTLGTNDKGANKTVNVSRGS